MYKLSDIEVETKLEQTGPVNLTGEKEIEGGYDNEVIRQLLGQIPLDRKLAILRHLQTVIKP